MEMNLDGKWKVTGKSGILQHLFGNIKYIKGCVGYNRLFDIKWGRFITTREDGEIVFTYDNGRVIDRLFAVGNDELLGRFYLGGKFIGPFAMERIKK